MSCATNAPAPAEGLVPSMPRNSLCVVMQACKSQGGTGPNLWQPTSDGTGVTHVTSLPGPGQGSFSDRFVALEWIQFIAQHILPPFGLQLQGEVWYQGMSAHAFKCAATGNAGPLMGNSTLLSAGRESLDIGVFYADATGTVAHQTIKLWPGTFGAVACNNVALLETQPLDALKTKDGFGRTAAMLAALFNSWAVLQHLLKVSDGVDWSETQSAQASMPLLTWSACPVLPLIPLEYWIFNSRSSRLIAHLHVQVGHIGKTPMHYLCSNPPTAAAAQQYAEIVSMLPNTLSSIVLDARDAQGFTPLVLAVKSRNMTMVQWLLSHWADPNIDSATQPVAPRPITAAVQLKDAQYLEKLLAFGASVHVCDVMGKTPLGQALDLQHAEHLQLLVLYGANVDIDHIQFRHGATSTQTIRQIIKDFPVGTSGAALKTAMAQGLAARRRLVVLTLGARIVPALSRDILQLICQYSSLMP